MKLNKLRVSEIIINERQPTAKLTEALQYLAQKVSDEKDGQLIRACFRDSCEPLTPSNIDAFLRGDGKAFHFANSLRSLPSYRFIDTLLNKLAL